MTLLTVNAKGEVTLEDEVLAHLHVKPGDKINVVPLPNGKLEVSAGRVGEKRGLEKFFGSIENKSGVHLTIDEIQQEIEKAWAGEP